MGHILFLGGSFYLCDNNTKLLRRPSYISPLEDSVPNTGRFKYIRDRRILWLGKDSRDTQMHLVNATHPWYLAISYLTSAAIVLRGMDGPSICAVDSHFAVIYTSSHICDEFK